MAVKLSGKDQNEKHPMKKFNVALFVIFSEENHCELVNRLNL